VARRRAKRHADQEKKRDDRTGDSPERQRERANEVPPKVPASPLEKGLRAGGGPSF
jgi:hypothetical protein